MLKRVLFLGILFSCLSVSSLAQETSPPASVCDVCVESRYLCTMDLKPFHVDQKTVSPDQAVSLLRDGVSLRSCAAKRYPQPPSIDLIRLGHVCRGTVIEVLSPTVLKHVAGSPGLRMNSLAAQVRGICVGHLVPLSQFVNETVAAQVTNELRSLVTQVSPEIVRAELERSLKTVLSEREAELVKRVTDIVVERLMHTEPDGSTSPATK